MHLRRCLTCGHIGCCDNSPNKHATAHVHETGHPVLQSYEPGEDWVYCYVDDVYLEGPEFAEPAEPSAGLEPGAAARDPAGAAGERRRREVGRRQSRRRRSQAAS